MNTNSWVVENLQRAFDTWNRRMSEIWALLAQSPSDFKGGAVWSVVTSIAQGLTASALALVVLFFVLGLMRSTLDISQFKRPEYALRFFLRFALAKAAVTYSMEILTALFTICQDILRRCMSAVGGTGGAALAVPSVMVEKINALGFLESIPLWAVTLLGSLLVTALTFVMILTVYGRFFRLYTCAALAPVPLSTFAGEGTSQIGVHFLKTFASVCLEGAVVIIGCLLYSALIGSNPVQVEESASAVNMVWSYMAETVFGMLVLVGCVKGSQQAIRDLLGT